MNCEGSKTATDLIYVCPCIVV